MPIRPDPVTEPAPGSVAAYLWIIRDTTVSEYDVYRAVWAIIDTVTDYATDPDDLSRRVRNILAASKQVLEEIRAARLADGHA